MINQELRIPIWGDISRFVFLNVGNAWRDKSQFGSDLATGVGLGIRAETPVG